MTEDIECEWCTDPATHYRAYRNISNPLSATCVRHADSDVIVLRDIELDARFRRQIMEYEAKQVLDE